MLASSRNPRAAANRADIESAPTEVCNIAGFACSRLATGFAPVRRGGIYPARGCSRRREVRGTMRASSPTEVCGVVKFVVSRVATGPARFVGEGHGPPAGPYTATFSRLVSMFSPFRRAGVYARRTAANSKNMFRRPFFQRPPCGGVKPPPCGARQTLYRQETNAFLNRLTHPQNGWVFYARRRALVFRHGSR